MLHAVCQQHHRLCSCASLVLTATGEKKVQLIFPNQSLFVCHLLDDFPGQNK